MPLVGAGGGGAGAGSSSSAKGGSASTLGKAVNLMRQLPDLERLLARCVARACPAGCRGRVPAGRLPA